MDGQGSRPIRARPLRSAPAPYAQATVQAQWRRQARLDAASAVVVGAGSLLDILASSVHWPAGNSM
jgi:hypothetical protein